MSQRLSRYKASYLLVFLCFLGLSSTSSIAQTEPKTEVWVGHQVLFGTAKIPFVGNVKTRSETYMLAEVRRSKEGIDIKQYACGVRMQKVAGVNTRVDDASVRKLPRTQISYRSKKDSPQQYNSYWVAGWDTRDHDQDGKPGVTIHVDMSVCGGSLYIASRSENTGSGQFYGKKFIGDVAVDVETETLGTSNVCLGLGARDKLETMRGKFAYLPVPPETSCSNLSLTRWPIDAERFTVKP